MSGTSGQRIFISYTESDLNWASWIAGVIEEAGHVAVIQVWDSPPGDNFAVWINERLDDCDLVMPVYSPAYFRSTWCRTEWTAALNHRPLIPVRVEKCEVPSILSRVSYVDLVGKTEAACRDLILRGLRESSAPRVPVGGFPGDGPSQRTAGVVRSWKRASWRATVVGLLGATAVFIPGDPGEGGTAGDGDVSDFGLDVG